MNKKTLDVNDVLSSELSIINLICQLDKLCEDQDDEWSIHDELHDVVWNSFYVTREVIDSELKNKEL